MLVQAEVNGSQQNLKLFPRMDCKGVGGGRGRGGKGRKKEI